MIEDADYRLRDADRRIRDLDSRLDELQSEHRSLSDKFGYTEDLDYELRSIRSDISSCEEKVEELDDELRGRIDDTDQAVKRLVQQVRLLESQLLAAGGAPNADLDTFTKDQRSLARALQRGWRARSLLLDDGQRYVYQQRLGQHRQTAEQYRAQRAAVIDTVGALAATRSGSAAHDKAAQQLRDALTRERQLRQGLDRQAGSAAEAEQALAADEKTRAEQQSVMAAGARAETRLTLALRSRLADAVSARAVLPAWFVTVLGAAPPASGTQKWLETATQVLLYRLTYDITDQVLALGSKPPEADRHRRQWHDQLIKDLRRW